MVACVAAATSGAEQEACRKGPAGARRSGSAASGPVADALKSTMGKSSVTHVDVESYVRKAGRKRVGEMMGDCVEGATNDNEKTKCRMETAKEAVAVSMGQNSTSVAAHEVVEFVRRGAQEAVQVMMASCNEAAAGDTSGLSLC